MARTKQTARRSTGGMAPRRQMSYQASRGNGGDNAFADQQVSIFKETGKRTIVVEGTAELDQVPDLVHLSFLISETGHQSLEEGIQKVLAKIARVRQVAVDECNVPNGLISSDSIGSKAKKTEIGRYVSSTSSHNNGTAGNRNDDAFFRVLETKVEYEVKSVLRLRLEGAEMVENAFSKLCYLLLAKEGLRTHEAPVYELSEITDLRNVARTQACDNAKTKAASILEALNDPTIQLGPPLCLTDLHVDLMDDAEDSFLGNNDYWSSWETTRRVLDDDEEDDSEGDSKEPATKKAKQSEEEKIKDTQPNNDGPAPLADSVVEQIFVAPSIKVAARIQAIFETVQVTESDPA